MRIPPDFGFAVGDAHAFAAAARTSLDHHGIADLLGDLDCLHIAFDDPEMAGHGGNLGGRRPPFRFDLVAHSGDGFWIRPNEDDSGGRERLGKAFALGQKAIAWMDGFGAALLARGDNLLDDKVAFSCRRGTNRDGGIRHLDVQGILVGLRIDGDRFDSQSARGLDDPAGDFAAIGNQDTLEHAVSEAPDAGYLACGVIGGKVNLAAQPVTATLTACGNGRG